MKPTRPVFPESDDDVSHPLLSTFLSARHYTGTSGTFSHLILSSAHWGRCHCHPCLFYWHFPTPCFQLPLTWVSSWPGLMQLNGIWETLVLSWPGLFHIQVLFHSCLTPAKWIHFSIIGCFPDHVSSLVYSLLVFIHFFMHPPFTECLLWARHCCTLELQSPGPQGTSVLPG